MATVRTGASTTTTRGWTRGRVGGQRARAATLARASKTTNARFALLFDCDGVIVETEELHRMAYNGAFEAFGLTIGDAALNWSVEYYDVLQNTVGGGKPKMKWHFKENGWPNTPNAPAPESYADRDALVDVLQDKKTEIYKKIVEEVAVARPGILELMDEAIADPSIAVGICSAATKAGFEKVVNSVVGKERLSKLDVLMAGDDVTKKKPDPLIYNLARDKVGLPASKCLVIEDSIVGLRAAVGANMPCLITPCGSNQDADFMGEGASCVVSDVSEVRLAMLFPENAQEPQFDGVKGVSNVRA